MKETRKAKGSAALPGPRPEMQGRSRGIYWILGGLVITGILAGYNWLRSLPRD
jgi:hypothetical protein